MVITIVSRNKLQVYDNKTLSDVNYNFRNQRQADKLS